MNENENPFFNKNKNNNSNLKDIQNKNFNFLNLAPQDSNIATNAPMRTPLKDKLFNFNAINSKTPLNKNMLKSQINNKNQATKTEHFQQEIKESIKESKNNNIYNKQNLKSKDFYVLNNNTQNKNKSFIDLKKKLALDSKNISKLITTNNNSIIKDQSLVVEENELALK